MSPRLVAFDLDGTLVDTAPEIADAVNRYFAQIGRSAVSEAQVRSWVGHGARRLLQQALGVAAVSDGVLADFMRHYVETSGTRGVPYPGVVEMLQRLREAGIALAVVTNKESRCARRVLDANALSFDLLVAGDTVERRKPDPLPLTHALAHFGAAPDEALFVGDSAVDVACARAAGVPVWAVSWGYGRSEEFADAAPDRMIQHMAVILSAAKD